MDRLRSREQTRSQRSIGYHYPYFDWLGWTVRYHETPPPPKKNTGWRTYVWSRADRVASLELVAVLPAIIE
jgi:hypothetical protein